jgi:hypothetical protein
VKKTSAGQAKKYSMVDIRGLCSGRSLARFLGKRFLHAILKNKKPAQVILAGFFKCDYSALMC